MREGETSTFYVRLRHLPPETAYPEELTITLSKIFQDVDLTPSPNPGGVGAWQMLLATSSNAV